MDKEEFVDQVAGTVVHVYGGKPKKLGSLEEYFLLLTRRLREAGYRSVFCFGSLPEPHLIELYEEAGAEIRVAKLTSSRCDMAVIKSYVQVFNVERPSVVNVHFGHTGINALIAARLCGIRKRVWTKHSLDALSYRDHIPFYKHWFHTINWEAIWATDIIAVSQAVRREFLDHSITRKVHQLRLGVVLERFANGKPDPKKREVLGIPDNRIVVACVSQARPEKGLQYLVEALGLLKKKSCMPYVLIVGGGPLTEELEKLARKLGVAGDINFCAVRSDVEDILALSDFSVLPSLEDAAPLALMESMAAGKPVVGSRVGGIPELLVDGHNGLLVNPGNAQDLADAMNRICSGTIGLEQLAQGARTSANLFDVECGVENTIKVYFQGLNIEG